LVFGVGVLVLADPAVVRCSLQLVFWFGGFGGCLFVVGRISVPAWLRVV
jgi:hypothetical protein